MNVEISRPEQMRQAVARYVAAAHVAYAAARRASAATGHTPGDRLQGEPFSVLAVAAGDLHLIATRDRLSLPEVATADIDGEVDGLQWRLRFFDPVLVPELGRLGPGPDAAADVRRVLGVSTWLYHLVTSPAAGLSAHHARHTGLALAGTEATPA